MYSLIIIDKMQCLGCEYNMYKFNMQQFSCVIPIIYFSLSQVKMDPWLIHIVILAFVDEKRVIYK